MRDLLRAVCALFSVAIWILSSIFWLMWILLGIIAIGAGGGWIIIGLIVIIAGALLLVQEFKTYQERLKSCSRGDFNIRIFGVPVSLAVPAGAAGAIGQFFETLEGLTCDAAGGLLAAAERALEEAEEGLERAGARRDSVRNRVAALAAALVVAIVTVAVVSITTPWELAAAIAAVAAVTAALVAAAAELVALEAEVRMLEGIVAGLNATVKELRASVEALCPTDRDIPPDPPRSGPPATSPPKAEAIGDK